MSFFTSNAYASFHQHLPPKMQGLHADTSGTSSIKNLSLHKHAALSADQFADNASFVSTGSSASTLSEFDPLSPLNGFRSPRMGATAFEDDAMTAVSFKIYDQVDNEEWGEFVNCSPLNEYRTIDRASPAKPSASSPRRTNTTARTQREFVDVRRSSRAPSGDESIGGGDNEDEELIHAPPRQKYKAVLYDHGSVLTQISGGDDCRPELQRSSSALESFATAVLSHFSSFRGEKQSQPQQQHPKPSWTSRLFSGAEEVHRTASARGYDSYDVTFERGPIGLELETDWYGRQAVVKGFSSQDGPARQCGVIRIGDVLTAIDGASCLDLSFQETLAKLRQVSNRRHVLHFKSLEAAGDLSVYNSDAGILQAKKFIHEYKERFYRQPARAPNGGLIIGCVERLRGETVTAFNFHREDTGEFIMACSCVNECTGTFIFHTLQDSHLRDFKSLPQSEDSAVYLGQMVPNFLGTEFTVLDHQQKRRNELGFLLYSSNVLGRVPNFLKCVFPRQPTAADDEDDESNENSDDDGRSQSWTSSSAPFGRRSTMMDQNGSIAERYKNVKQQRQLSLVERLRAFSFDDLETSSEYTGGNISEAWRDADDHDGRSRSMRLASGAHRSASTQSLSLSPYGAIEQIDYQCDLLTFETKKPAWNDELGAWTLNFHGRVKLASKKNFLLVPEQGNSQMEGEFPDDRVFLRFGKVSKTRFSLDYQAPICPLMALAIVCSSFAHKIAVT